MSRFQNMVSRLTSSGSVSSFSAGAAVDFGSSFTRVVVNGKVVFHEPSCVAIHGPSGAVLAFGKAAADLVGKTPESIQVIFPVRHGKVIDQTSAEIFLAAVWRKIFKRTTIFQPFFIHRAVTGYGADTTEVQKEALKKTFLRTGAHNVHLKNKNEAIAQRMLSQKHLPSIFFVIDLGGMTTELSIFSRQEMVLEKTIAFGGDDFTQAVLQVVRSQYHCEVGWLTAEKIKKSVGGLFMNADKPRQSIVRGVDLFTHLPKTIQFSATHLEEPFLTLAGELMNEVKQFCSDVPPELLAQTLDGGVFLTGGGSLLQGLSQFVMKNMQCPVLLSTTPFEDVVYGL